MTFPCALITEKINMNAKSKLTAGMWMSAAGYLMILVNASAYLWGWNGNYTPLGIIGLVLVVTGLNLSRKHKPQD